MIRKFLIAAALLGAAPAYAFGPAGRPTRSDPAHGPASSIGGPTAISALYIRADTGRWYHVSLRSVARGS